MSGTSGQPSFEVAPSPTTIKSPNGALPRHVPFHDGAYDAHRRHTRCTRCLPPGHPPAAGWHRPNGVGKLVSWHRPGGVGKLRFGVYRRARLDFRAECNAHHKRTAGRRGGPLGVGAALQGYGVATELERAKNVVDEPGHQFQVNVVATFVAGTALLIWLAALISRHGVGSGF